MGICESKTKKENKPIESQKMNNCEEENSNNKETHPTSKNSKNEKSSIEEIENNKCPELAKYENSMYLSGKRSEFSHLNNKTVSIFSSGQTEEEVIIRGEINKNCKNKEEDFDNNSFKKLVKNNGGIIIKKDDKNSAISSIHGTSVDRLFLSKEKLSEIKSIHTSPVYQKSGKLCSNNLVKNNMSENNKSIINQRIKKFLNNNNNNNDLLRRSDRINVSMNDNYPLLSIPKTDEPLPDIEELSTESPILIGNHSLISE
jgi:hypothetical protein